MHIQLSTDCGNSPKNALIEQLAIGLLSRDRITLTRLTTSDLTWILVGSTTLHGQDAILDRVGILLPDLATLTITNLLTHGRSGAVNGIASDTHGQQYRFCHVMRFNSARATHVAEIMTYWIASGQ